MADPIPALPRASASLRPQLDACARHRDAWGAALDDLADWLASPRRAATLTANPTPDDHAGEAVRSVLACARALRDAPTLQIAILGPADAGKTELAGALCLPDRAQRPLPASVGAAPCVVEIGWNPDRGASLWLLPIETRSEATSIGELRREPDHWARLALRPDDLAQVAATLAAVRQTRSIAPALAARLGLPTTRPAAGPAATGALIAVPRWRYALLSLPYPVLRDGLVVYDLPGPPELALDPDLVQAVLENADACCLVLPAEASPDAAAASWRRLLAPGRAPLLVALNAPDWPGRGCRLRTGPDAAPGLPAAAVLPVCARRALLGRVAGKPRLLAESGLPALEAALAAVLATGAAMRRLPGCVEREIASRLGAERRRVTAAIAAIDTELRALRAVIARGHDDLVALRVAMQADEARRQGASARLEAVRGALNEAAERARGPLAGPALDELLAAGRRELAGAWHSLALRRTLRARFARLRAIFACCETEVARLRALVGQQAKARGEAGGGPVAPPVFDLTAPRVELALLQAEADAFLRPGRVLLAGRERLLARFEGQLLLPARELLRRLGVDWDAWQAAVLAAFAGPVRDQQARVAGWAGRLARCDEICRDGERRAADLRRQQLALARDLSRLRDLGERLGVDGPDGTRPVRPTGPAPSVRSTLAARR